MPIKELYHSWNRFVNRLHPKERVTRKQNFIWLLVGLYQSRSVHLSKIAEKIPGLTYLPSRVRRLQRFLGNRAIRVRDWYEPIAISILQRLGSRELHLILDGSKVGFGHQLLLVAVAYRKRSIPLAWTWVKSCRGHSSSWKQLALLSYVHELLPPGTRVLVVGDVEFGEVQVQKLLKKWCWKYVLRQSGRYLLKRKGQRHLQRLDSLVSQPAQQVWLEGCRLTAKHLYRVNLLAYWQPGEEAPWLLATNLCDPQATQKAYRLRMWIEETFGDLKGHGFDLEHTHLRNFLRLSVLTLAVILLYVWLLAFGSQVIKTGQRRLVDRHDRRDYSLFRIGRNMAERLLNNGLHLQLSLTFFT
jgi:Transposase DDE domain